MTHITASFDLFGSLSTSAVGEETKTNPPNDDYRIGDGTMLLFLDSQEPTHVILPPPPKDHGTNFGYSQTAVTGTAGQILVQDDPPETVMVNIFEPLDELFPIGFTMSLFGDATAQDVDNRSPGAALAFFNGDVTHTLLWGGITSVTDAATGEPIEDWSITSDSGFDYSKPAVEPGTSVPEPSTLVLTGLGGLLLLVSRRWPRRRS